MKLLPLLLIATVCWCGSAAAMVPEFINYQGRIAVNGISFNGTGQFKFALMDGSNGASVWSNDGSSTNGSEPAASVPVPVAHGLYAVLLGKTDENGTPPIPPALFASNDVRLRIWFNDGLNGSQRLGPDQRLASVPYAMVAATVPDGSITLAKLAPGLNTQLGTGTVNGVISCNTTNPQDAIVYIPGESIQARVGPVGGQGYPYRLTHVPAGNQTITARLADGRTASSQVAVTAGGTHTVNFPFLQTHYADTDGDGYGDPATAQSECTVPAGRISTAGDFNDQCSACYPGAPEICDNRDNNNNSQIDEGLASQPCYSGPAGTAGLGACRAGTISCTNGQLGSCVGQILPASEVCNGIDDDCDGSIDDGASDAQIFFRDADDDGFGNPNIFAQACSRPAGFVSNGNDCNDGDANVFPGATEVCNGLDDNCNAQNDEGFGQISCGTGACQRTIDRCVNGQLQNCVPGASSPEICNGIDDDCDGQADDGSAASLGCTAGHPNCQSAVCQAGACRYNNVNPGTRSCGIGACLVTVNQCANGQPVTCVPNAASPEVCNNVDDDCDGPIDEGSAASLGCDDNNPCTTDSCQSGNCVHTNACAPYTCNATGTACLRNCNSDNECVSTRFCSIILGIGTCEQKRGIGEPCTGNHQCLSNICSRGFCE